MTLTLVAGSETATGTTDGNGTTARFPSTGALAKSWDGTKIYSNMAAAGTMRKITLDGNWTVSTVTLSGASLVTNYWSPRAAGGVWVNWRISSGAQLQSISDTGVVATLVSSGASITGAVTGVVSSVLSVGDDGSGTLRAVVARSLGSGGGWVYCNINASTGAVTGVALLSSIGGHSLQPGTGRVVASGHHLTPANPTDGYYAFTAAGAGAFVSTSYTAGAISPSAGYPSQVVFGDTAGNIITSDINGTPAEAVTTVTADHATALLTSAVQFGAELAIAFANFTTGGAGIYTTAATPSTLDGANPRWYVGSVGFPPA